MGRRIIKRGSGRQMLDGKGFRLPDEIRYIQDKAADHDGRMVTVGHLILFSTDTGDAWLTDVTAILPLDWPGTGTPNQSTWRKPIPAPPSNGRATIASKGRQVVDFQGAHVRLDGFLDVAQRGILRFALGDAAGKAGALGDPEAIFPAIDENLSHTFVMADSEADREREFNYPDVAVAASAALPSYGHHEYVFPAKPNPRFKAISKDRMHGILGSGFGGWRSLHASMLCASMISAISPPRR
ncbi:MAG: hypothetical protein P4L56_24755 [Candidatus Sulfopaludibacter sp.]|nr:hypothetical protein [Candidatus Sulfopaludibacter sp.]